MADEMLDQRLEALVGLTVGTHEGAGLGIGGVITCDADAALQHKLRRSARREGHADGGVADDGLARLIIDAEQENGFRDRDLHTHESTEAACAMPPPVGGIRGESPR